MAVSAEVKKLDSIRQHKRVTRRQIVFPVIFVGIVLAIIVFMLVVPFSPTQFDDTENQISIVSNIMISLLVLCPMVLCLLLIFTIMILMTLAVHSTHRATAKRMRQLQVITRTTADKTAEMADQAGEQSIRVATKFAFFNPIFNIFDRPSSDQTDLDQLVEDKKEDDGTNGK